jgi:hypothetical protein
VQGMATHATEVIGAEPKFVSKSNLDLHLVLVNGSPVDVNNNAIDLSFGTSTGAPLLDFDGDTRDLNDLWVGADEE